MTGLQKIGYLTIGFGIGVFVSSMLYERELRKPIGEIEKYIPKNEDECDIIELPNHDESNFKKYDVEELAGDVVETVTNRIDEVNDRIEDLRKKALERRAELEANSSGESKKNAKTDYKSLYKKGEDKLKDILNQTSNSLSDEEAEYFEYLEKEEDDSPSDDYIEDDVKDTDLITERVEDNIEIYLDENPQDFITLIFYSGDMTVCDDREQLISNSDEVVGTVALNRLIDRGPGAENGTIFIRNLKTMLNYEIVLDESKYSETVLGIFERNLDKGDDGGDVDNR